MIGVPVSGIKDERLKLIIAKRNEGRFYSPSLKKWIPLGFNKYKSKCNSGPSTFYEAGGINIWNKWWNTHPKSATRCRLDEVGFKKVRNK